MGKYNLAFLLSLLFLIVGIITLSDYGINWDSANHMLRGQGYTEFLLTGKDTFGEKPRISPVLIQPGQRASWYYLNSIEWRGDPVVLSARPLPLAEYQAIQNPGERNSFYRYKSWDKKYLDNEEAGHLPFGDIMAAFSNRFFWGKLGLLGDIQSYDLFFLLVSAFGVFVVSIFAYEITLSKVAAIVAGLSLALFPLFFSEAHFNTKDPLQASLFAASVWAFWHFVKGKKRRWFFAFCAFVTMAMGIKWNIIFLPVILASWLFFVRRDERFKTFSPKRIIIYGLSVVLLIFFILVIISPYLWQNPAFKLLQTFQFYLSEGTGSDRVQPQGFILPFGFNAYPTILILFKTPEIIMFFAAIALFGVARKKIANDLKVGYLLLLWIIVPIVRVSLPNVWFYSGVRQFMEVLPPIAILSGVGAYFLLKNWKFSKFASPILIILTLIILLIPIMKLHPNENVYFNSFAGGLRGGADKNLMDGTLTYGNVYKQAADWLNKNAPKDSNVAFLSGRMYALSPLFLRPDISISPYHFSNFKQKGEYIIKVEDSLNPASFSQRFASNFLKPVYTFSIDGVRLLSIYKNDPQHSLKPLDQKEMLDFTINKISGEKFDYLRIDLSKEVNVTGIRLFSDCSSNLEFIKFLDSSHLNEKFNINQILEQGSRIYIYNRVMGSGGSKEFLFPGEKAAAIEIYPESQGSCFVKGVIHSIEHID